jgi:Family of unknown function (DUF5899)
MEVALPLIALSGLYIISKQDKQRSVNDYESFTNKQALPNTDIPNVNYPAEYPIVSQELALTSSLSNNNKFDSPGVYTDKFFNSDGTPVTTVPNTSNSSFSPYTSLSGQKVDGSYFQHNNMVPFFGSNLRTQIADSNSNEGILDTLNGSGSQIFSKQEVSPLFSPHENLQWANGAPNVNDFYQSRVNPSSKMSNVKPFAEQRVGPGLGLGYTTEGQGGFNSGMACRDQWLDRGVDELRVANKPKSTGLSLLGHEGPANSLVKLNGTVDQMGVMEKNRPERAFEMGHERLFTTTGIEKGPALRSISMFHDQARPETAASYSGIAGSSNPSTYTTGEYMPSTNIHLGPVPIAGANANGRYYANDGDYGIKSQTAYPNNRTENSNDSYYGIMGGAIGAVVAPLLDALRPSRRENTVGNLRPYQNPGSTVSQSYIFNPADRPVTTIRETTENSKFHLNVNANQNGGAYKVTPNQATDTYRQHTSDYYYAGNAGAGAGTREARPYDAEYNQRNNDLKSSTIQGYMVKGNMNIMNSYVNVQPADRDKYLINRRDVVPSMPIQTPDMSNMGRLQGNNSLYSNIQMDRNEPGILDSLKGNPYALSVTNAFR